MKTFNTSVFSLLLMLLFSTGIAEEKKIKLRGINNNKTFKPIQISISPDLLKTDKIKDLKSTYEAAKEFANKTDKAIFVNDYEMVEYKDEKIKIYKRLNLYFNNRAW